MGGQAAELSGPDLEVGIVASELADGAKLLGHAKGEAVLLVRRGANVFAVGATCTHYGAPLADGLVVDDTVRCPWHHACFSLRNGEAVRAPALNPIASWRVETRGDRLCVTGKIDPAAPAKPIEAPSSVVIVGGGAAGNAAAEMLRRRGYEGAITILSADASVPVDRPNLSKDYLAGTAPEDWIPLRPREFYEEHRIELRLGARVTKLDPKAREVTLASGEKVAYGALLLATGAEPVHLDLPGADAPHVHYLRTLADSRAIIAAAAKAKTVVVIGASFIALEAAAALRARGLEVHVVAPDERPLARIMGDAIGDLVRKVHEEHGVVFHLRETAKSIGPSGVVLASGSVIAADLVIVGVGVRPAIALAKEAGLSLEEGGVSVDHHLSTSAPHIYAAGDIACYPEPRTGEKLRIEHWVTAERQGQTAARNMLGAREPYDAAPFFWSQHYDLAIAYVGHAKAWDEVVVSGDVASKDFAVALKKGKRTLAVVTLNRDETSLRAEVAFEGGEEPLV